MTSGFLTARECPHPASGFVCLLPPHPSQKIMKSVKRGDEDVVVFQTIPLIARLWLSRAFCFDCKFTVQCKYSMF